MNISPADPLVSLFESSPHTRAVQEVSRGWFTQPRAPGGTAGLGSCPACPPTQLPCSPDEHDSERGRGCSWVESSKHLLSGGRFGKTEVLGIQRGVRTWEERILSSFRAVER